MVSNVQIDEVSNLAELESKRLTLLQKRAAADAKIQAARIEYLESQIRIGETQLNRMVYRAVQQLENWRSALRVLKPEPVSVEAPSEALVDAAVERAPIL